MEFQDIFYEKKEGVARVTINRPQVLNALRTQTARELVQAFEDVEMDRSIGVVVFAGAGDRAFCVGGDATDVAEGGAGYSPAMTVLTRRLHALIRRVPMPVIAQVQGWAIGGGHVLHLICDLTIASEKARFGQVGPRVGSFDAGFGGPYLAKVVGEKKAREIWFLCRQYSAQEALQMGLVNTVVPDDKLDEEVDKWCKEILALSPTAIRFMKAAFNSSSEFVVGTEAMTMAGCWLYYQTEEAQEGRNAFMQRRATDFARFRK